MQNLGWTISSLYFSLTFHKCVWFGVLSRAPWTDRHQIPETLEGLCPQITCHRECNMALGSKVWNLSWQIFQNPTEILICWATKGRLILLKQEEFNYQNTNETALRPWGCLEKQEAVWSPRASSPGGSLRGHLLEGTGSPCSRAHVPGISGQTALPFTTWSWGAQRSPECGRGRQGDPPGHKGAETAAPLAQERPTAQDSYLRQNIWIFCLFHTDLQKIYFSGYKSCELQIPSLVDSFLKILFLRCVFLKRSF